MTKNHFRNNLVLFKKRFPALYEIHEREFARAEISGENTASESGMELFAAKSGALSARENGTLLHSAYDPVKEAEKLMTAVREKPSAVVFYGFGLGYLPAAAAARFPESALVLVEPDVARFIASLFFMDFSAVFSAKECVVLVGADVHTAAGAVEQFAAENALFFAVPITEAENPRAEYFAALRRLLRLREQQKNANAHTLAAFGKLWQKNSEKNAEQLAVREGVKKFAGIARGMPACIVAAGPSLDAVLPRLADIQKRCVLVAVNTALGACLRAGTEPDFIVLTDPQFWAAQHIAGLKSPSSVLVTEIAVCPQVMRFCCREIVLCDSSYPAHIVRDVSRAPRDSSGGTLSLGKLAAGGSVASAAWDLARLLGAEPIFFAALDLGFPRTKTHARGSIFEERCHAHSHRLRPALTESAATLFSARMFRAKDYAGEELLSDERMTLYAWWFENEIAKDKTRSTASITEHSRALRGTRCIPICEVLALPDISLRKKEIFDRAAPF
jgi:hypothetical protein